MMWDTYMYRPRENYFSGLGHQASLKRRMQTDGNRSINDPNIENDKGSELAGLDNTPSSAH